MARRKPFLIMVALAVSARSLSISSRPRGIARLRRTRRAELSYQRTVRATALG
jgi:hypothetical protein